MEKHIKKISLVDILKEGENLELKILDESVSDFIIKTLTKQEELCKLKEIDYENLNKIINI